MLRFLLVSVLLTIAVRMVSRLAAAFMEGMRGDASPRAGVPQQGVQMARDPICGTFVVPDRAVSLTVGRDRLYFCSAACRDTYRAKTA